jgi:hypothetical protein
MRRISRLKLEHSSTPTHVQGIKQKNQSSTLQIYINCPSAHDGIRINQARVNTGRIKKLDISSRHSGVPKAAAPCQPLPALCNTLYPIT